MVVHRSSTVSYRLTNLSGRESWKFVRKTECSQKSFEHKTEYYQKSFNHKRSSDRYLLRTVHKWHLKERGALLFDEPMVEELHEKRSRTDAEAEDVQHELAER